MKGKKANIGFAAVLLSAILLIAAVMLVTNRGGTLTGATVYDPTRYIPSYCWNNIEACINLNEDYVIDGKDEEIFAKILNGTITTSVNRTLVNMADFDDDDDVTNAVDFQMCFVPLRDFYQDILGGRAFCNLPKGPFGEPNFSNCLWGCPDLNGDGYVDDDDYDIFQTLLGNETAETYYPGADMTGDGLIGTEDADCMSIYYDRIVTCNMPLYFQHTNACPDLTDEQGVGNDGYVDMHDENLFITYWEEKNLKIDFNGDGKVNWIDRIIFYQYYDKDVVVNCDLYHAPWHIGGINKQNIAFENTHYSMFGGVFNLSQSFVAGYEGQLTKIRLRLKNRTPDLKPVVVDVYEANATSPFGPNQTYVLATTSITPSFELNRSSWVTIPFRDPPVLEENNMYHLVVSSPESDNNSYYWYFNDVTAKDVDTAKNVSFAGESFSESGWAVATGDINNDGYDDLIIGAYANNSDIGAVYLIYGPVDGTNINLNTANASWGGESSGDYLGYSLASGDINGDGYDDILVSAHAYSTSKGAIYVIYGPVAVGTHENIANTPSFTKWYGESSNDYAGYSVAAADINKDGYDDIIAGAPTNDMDDDNDEGAVYVVYGPHYGSHSLSEADIKIYGEEASNRIGKALATGDINDDGYDDIVIGAPDYDSSTGAVYVMYGPLPDLDEINISSADAIWTGENSADLAGWSATTSDINNDGYDDVIAGAYRYGGPNQGKVYLIYGPTSGTNNLGSADASFTGGADHQLGSSVSAGDIDDDGYEDIIVSAPYYDITGDDNKGAVYAVYGPVERGTHTPITNAWGTKWFGESNQDKIGGPPRSLAVGDINNDDYGDVIIGARHYGTLDQGKTYLFYGPVPRDVNGSFWNQSPSAGWSDEPDNDFLFQLWMSSACADLNADGECYSDDDDLITPIPDKLRYSGTPGWNPKYDLNGDGKILDEDSQVYIDGYYTTDPQINISEVTSCKDVVSPYFNFGTPTKIMAQAFTADVEKIYYVGLYLRLDDGSGTRNITVEIREAAEDGPDMNVSGLIASTVMPPVTESSFDNFLYKAHFTPWPAEITPNGKYFIVVSCFDCTKTNSYAWQTCKYTAEDTEKAVNGGRDNESADWEWTYPYSNRSTRFIVYKGNNESINKTLDVNNDNIVDINDYYLVLDARGEWSGERWSAKVDFNAEFGIYEKLKDYTLGFRAYLDKVVTCSLPNWPAGRYNGRCESYAPYYENFQTAPEDCPACNFDGFCSSSEDFTYCPDCFWPPEVPRYNNFGCSTTEFFTVDDIGNVSNAVIEDCDYGKIELLEPANFTGLSLDNDLSINYNYISLISPTLDALNKSANIYLYNLTYVHPWVLYDGDRCPDSRCAFVDYINDKDFEFNVASIGTVKEWNIEIIDGNATDDVGQHTSIEIDDYDKLHISYYDVDSGTLKHAKWDGLQWHTRTIDDSGDVGKYASLAIDTKNQPHISYYDKGNNKPKYAHYTGLRWDIEDADSNAGRYSSIATDSNNSPHISYIADSGNPKYAYYNGTWNREEIESTTSNFTSIAIDSNNNPHVSYYVPNVLQYAFCTANCTVVSSNWNKTTVDTTANVGKYSSITIDSNNQIHISYYDATNQNLKYAFCTADCGDSINWNTTTIDNSTDVGKYTSITTDSSNNPHISYYDNTSTSLKYAYHNGTDWIIQTIDNSADVGEYASIALDKYDNVYISYYDRGNGTLKLASFTSKTDYSTIEAAPDITAFNGSATTNLSIKTGIDLENVSNFTLENEYGKIEFLVPVNISPVNLTNLNLSRDIEITYNNISLNIERLPMLSIKPARLTLYDLNILYPNVLRNYYDCPEEKCSFISYSDGTLVFNITSFSTYSAEDIGRPYIPVFLVFSFSVLSFFIVIIILELAKGGKRR